MSSRPATTPSNTLTCGWVKPKSTCTTPLYLRMVENSEVKNIVYARPDGQNDYNFRETRRPTHRRFALTYLFFKIRSSNFQSCFVSAWNAHFRCLLGLDRPGSGTIFEFLKISKNDQISGQLYFFGIPNSENCAASRAAEAQKTPEMSVSGRDTKSLKIWDPNFEKQKK